MPDRTEVERIVVDAYSARARGDAREVLRDFAEGAAFTLVGSHPATTSVSVTGWAAVHAAMDGLVQSFSFVDPTLLVLLVDGDRAAAHVRLTVRATATGREVETELMDLITFEQGRIVEYRQFCDTALVPWLLGQDAAPR